MKSALQHKDLELAQMNLSQVSTVHTSIIPGYTGLSEKPESEVPGKMALTPPCNVA